MTNEKLLIKARRDYPIGIKFISPENNRTYIIKNDRYWIGTSESILASINGHSGEYIYYNDKWAKIVSKPKKIIQIY